MKIRALKLRIIANEGEFGFYYKFSRGLTVIKGNNSSGKSTLFNTLLYGLGMEELIGGRDERVLPYGVRDYFVYEGKDLRVLASEVLLEIESSPEEIVTLRRAIKHDIRQPKLIEIFAGPCLTADVALVNPKSTYLHDGGGAQKEEGFHRFLEDFLHLKLPSVSTSTGSQVKLYIQTLFAAFAVEQKRGWTDYIAGIPFYRIREAKTRVVEFLLGLDVFDLNVLKSNLDVESIQIQNEWSRLVLEIQAHAAAESVSIEGLPIKPDVSFIPTDARLIKFNDIQPIHINEHVEILRAEYKEISDRANNSKFASLNSSTAQFESSSDSLRETSFMYEKSVIELNLLRASLDEYQKLASEIDEDLDRNKTSQKLRTLGADFKLKIAEGLCPTCHQSIEDSLLREAVSGPLMSLEENIAYLNIQKSMLEKQISGTKDAINRESARVSGLSKTIDEKQKILKALRGDINSGAIESRALIRRQVQIENEVELLDGLQKKFSDVIDKIVVLSKAVAKNRANRSNLPQDIYSENDDKKIALFGKFFRANASSFGYESAEIKDVKIHHGSLAPVLQDIEFRGISKKKVADIVHDSSASDFVRLIWSYLLALYETSSHPTAHGNHLGILLFDEPGQHSMRAESQHALLRSLAALEGLQSIVAASFDENVSVFEQATNGVVFELIEWNEKLIRPF